MFLFKIIVAETMYGVSKTNMKSSRRLDVWSLEYELSSKSLWREDVAALVPGHEVNLPCPRPLKLGI